MTCRFSFWRYHILGVIVFLTGPILFIFFQLRNPLFLALYGIAIPLFLFSTAHAIVNKDSLIIKDGNVYQHYPLITRTFRIDDYTDYSIKKEFLSKVISARKKDSNEQIVLIRNTYNCTLEDILEKVRTLQKAKNDS